MVGAEVEGFDKFEIRTLSEIRSFELSDYLSSPKV